MKNKVIFYNGLSLLVTLIVAAVLTSPVRAAEVDPDGVVDAGETINDDLLMSAENASMDGIVNGNLLISGQTVTISGTVNGDVLTGGTNIIISKTAVITGNLFVGSSITEIEGRVEGSVFGGSTALKLKDGAFVGHNLFYGAYALEMQPGAKVGTDVYAGMYQAALGGDIGRNLNLGAAAVELAGLVGGDVTLEMGEDATAEENPGNFMQFMPFTQQPGVPAALQPGLRVAKGAVIQGKLNYTAGINYAKDIQSQPGGGVVYLTPVPQQQPESAQPASAQTPAFLAWFLKVLRNIITLLFFGLLLVRFVPDVLRRLQDVLHTRSWASLGYGALVAVLGYGAMSLAFAVLLAVVLLLGALTLGGLGGSIFWIGFTALALICSVFTVLVLFGSKLVAAQLGGEWLVEKFVPSLNGKKYWAMSVGVLIYVLLAALPFVGWVFGLLATFAGIGALWLFLRTPRQTPLVA